MRHIQLSACLLGAWSFAAQAQAGSPSQCNTHPVCRVTVITVLFGPPAVAPTDYVTVTEAYDCPIKAKAAKTIPPTEDAPGTIIIYQPGEYVTITTAYTGKSSITAPITTTVALLSGDQPGTVLVETQDDYTTITELYPGTSPIDTPITKTLTPLSSGEPSTVIIEPTTMAPRPGQSYEPTTSEEPATSATSSEPPGHTFSCDAGGFLIQRNTLYRLNLATGANPVVKAHVGDGGNINAIGYNVLDNFLYAFISIGDKQQQLIRIDADGNSTLLPLIVPAGLNVGDVDENGQFWVSARGSRWAQIDLKPGSSTFGELIDEGKSKSVPVADWVYLENGGDYLYSIMLGDTETAVRWSRTTHSWETLADYGGDGPVRKGFGALYAVGDELWGSDNQTGDILAFPVLDSGAKARKVSDGPITDSNDGARCFKAPPPE